MSVPLFTYAYEQTVNLADVQLHGFIPMIGQMFEANANTPIVDEVVKVVCGTSAKLFSPLFSQWKWVSAQYSAKEARVFNSTFGAYAKMMSHLALPVFAC